MRYTLKNDCDYKLVIKKSKFFAYSKSIMNEDDAKDYINFIRSNNRSATHVCYGYKLKDYYKYSDDNEPKNTAGKPIFDVIDQSNLDNIIIVVVRYFGGIELGRPGLYRAYYDCAKGSIENCELCVIKTYYIYSITFDFDRINKVEHFLSKNAIVIDREYKDKATIIFKCLNGKIVESIRELLINNYEIKFIEEKEEKEDV